MQPSTIHFRSIRLLVNAGLRFPACYANARLLDLDKSRLDTTGERRLVTCQRCLKIITATMNKSKA